MFYSDEKLAVLIDGKSLYAASRAIGFDIDYKRLRAEFARRGRLKNISYFVACEDVEEGEHDALRPMTDWMDYNGYHVVTVRSKTYTVSGERRSKDNMLMELAIKAVEIGRWVDHIVLFSGNNDLTPVVRFLQREGVRVSIASTLEINQVSDELRRQADNFIEVRDLRDTIQREIEEERALAS